MRKKLIAIGIGIIVIGGSGVFGYYKYRESSINKELYAGIEAMNIDDYKKSKEDMKNVLELDLNNVQAKNILEIINIYEISQNYFDEGKLNESEEELSKLPNEYLEYSIKNKVEKLKENIKVKKDNVNKINNQLNSINDLIEKNEFKKAKEELNKIDIEIGTEEQKKTLEGYKNKVNDGIQKLELEEKKEEEAKKREEEKKLAEKKDKENNKSNGTSVVNSTINNGPIYYENKEIGLSMSFPGSWRGKYKIINHGKDGITIMMKLNQTTGAGEGRLISIESETTYGMLDSVKIIQSKNGVKYYVGTPTDFPISGDNSQYDEFKRMARESYNIVQGTKAIN